jgi:Cu(I)/Ag(I) efflux system membrane fusion protein
MGLNRLLVRMAITGSILLPVTVVLMPGCHSNIKTTAANQNFYYTCPMHSQIHEKNPGNCPICGLKLVKVGENVSNTNSLDTSIKYLVEPVTRTVVGNFNVISPVKINPPDTIKAEGYSGFDERALNTVATRVSGRIEKLYIKYTNQPIRKGQPLMKLYSPQLLSAQRNLLQALKDKDTSIISDLEESLYNLGMNKQEVDQVVQTGHPVLDVIIYSPYDGISQKMTSEQNTGIGKTGNDEMTGEAPSVNPSEKPEYSGIQEGMYVNEGQTVFSIQNITHIWAILNVFGSDLARISLGDRVNLFAAADPGKMITGHVDLIPPYRTLPEKTSRVRIYVDSLPENWKIGTLLLGNIIIDKDKSGWFVPLSAVNIVGTRSIVWVRDENHFDVFHATTIVTGNQIGNYIQVISGINDADKIAANAAYMVDSDSFTQ